VLSGILTSVAIFGLGLDWGMSIAAVEQDGMYPVRKQEISILIDWSIQLLVVHDASYNKHTIKLPPPKYEQRCYNESYKQTILSIVS